jgi:hypothetical protein
MPPVKKPTQKAVRAARALEAVSHPGLIFSHKHHVFIAKAKRGELWALNHLSNPAKATITPLFEMWPAPVPRKKKGSDAPPKPQKPLNEHATDLLATVRDDWGALPFFLDTRYITTGGMPSHKNAKIIFDIARSISSTWVPVTSITFSPDYQQVIREVIATDHRGAMVRLIGSDFTDPAVLRIALTNLLGVLGTRTTETDILIDLETKRTQVEVQTLGAAYLATIPSVSEWRTLTVAAGCIPKSISDMKHSRWYTAARSDWLGWSHLTRQGAMLLRKPTYGDYGIRCGGKPEEVPRGPDPNLRYSDAHKVIVRREKKTSGAIRTLCAAFVARPEFTQSLSQGDREIAARAATPNLTKNAAPEQWIEWCTNHHLELTASQIRSLP